MNLCWPSHSKTVMNACTYQWLLPILCSLFLILSFNALPLCVLICTFMIYINMFFVAKVEALVKLFGPVQWFQHLYEEGCVWTYSILHFVLKSFDHSLCASATTNYEFLWQIFTFFPQPNWLLLEGAHITTMKLTNYLSCFFLLNKCSNNVIQDP